VRNQALTALTVVVHPVNNYSAANVDRNVTVVVASGETFFDVVFDKVISSGSDSLTADHLFYPVAVEGQMVV